MSQIILSSLVNAVISGQAADTDAMAEFLAMFKAKAAKEKAKAEFETALTAAKAKTAKTRKPRRSKVAEVPAAPLPGTTAHALAEQAKLARPSFIAAKNDDQFNDEFDFFVRELVTLTDKGEARASGHKAFKNRKATATTDAMVAIFALIREGKKNICLRDIAIKARRHEDSIRGHCRKLLPYAEWLASGKPKVQKNSIAPAIW